MSCKSFITFIFAAALPSIASAQPPEVFTWTCERGQQIEAVFLQDNWPYYAIVRAENKLVTLENVKSASGSRYQGANPLESHYVFWIKGDEALLEWHDAQSDQVTSIFQNCRRK